MLNLLGLLNTVLINTRGNVVEKMAVWLMGNEIKYCVFYGENC